jgi:hypothetical protein
MLFNHVTWTPGFNHVTWTPGFECKPIESTRFPEAATPRRRQIEAAVAPDRRVLGLGQNAP